MVTPMVLILLLLISFDEMEKFEEKSAPPNKLEQKRLLGGVSRAKIKEATADIINSKDELITVNKSDYLALAHSVDVLLRLVDDSRRLEAKKNINKMAARMEAKASEPRTQLANERTFMNWMNLTIQLFLLGVAIAALFQGSVGALVSGVLFAVISIFIVFYAMIVFSFRVRGHFYNDRYGPIAMSVMVIGAMTASLVSFIYFLQF